MSVIESAAIRVVRDLAQRWPLDDEDRCVLAEFIALQAVRGPAWRAMHERQLREARSAYDDSSIPPAVVDAVVDHLLGDTNRHRRLVGHVAPLATLMGHMQWALLCTPTRRFVLSDQPVVMLGLRGGAVDRCEPFPRSGILSVGEVRMPLDPRRCLLMTWRSGDDVARPVNLSPRHAANVNALTVAQADQHWFFPPDAPIPPIAPGQQDPLAPQLFPDYDLRAIEASPLRARAADKLNAWLDGTADSNVITVPSRTTWRGPRAA